MQTPGTYNITIEQNADWLRSFVLTDDSNVAINLTGATVIAQVWTADKMDKLADMTVTYTNRTAGSFSLSLTGAQTDAIGSSGVWDLLVVRSDGSRDYWLRGTATLSTGYSET